MSCFIVSCCFKLDETIDKSKLNTLFHFAATMFLKQPINGPRQSSCFIVSVVSIYIHPSFETSYKVLGAIGRARVFMLIGRQDYTKPLAAPALLLVQRSVARDA